MITLRPIATANAVLPTIRGTGAFRAFCTPRLARHRSAHHERLAEHARYHLRSARAQRLATAVGEIQTYIFEPNERRAASAILVHGWAGEAAFMVAFADYMRRRGIRSVLLDLPAHGQSAGRQTNLMDCAHAVREAASAMGPIQFAIGHSIGGLAALVAGEGRQPMPGPYPFEAYVLLAMPDRFSDVTRRFADEQALSAAGLNDLELRLERLAQRNIADFTGSNLLAATGRPTLLLHAHDDQEVPFEDAERLVVSAPSVELHALDGLGHHMLLCAPPAVRAAAAFLGRFR